MLLRKAHPEEQAAAYQCLEDAKAFQRAQGFIQWHDGYPTAAMVEEDIAAGIGYVFMEGSTLAGYCCIIMGEEPAYRNIDGAWKTDRPYAVVHRMALSASCRAKGLSAEAFALIKELCRENDIHAIRIDTHKDNLRMQHVLAREGFLPCGTILFDDGPKLAFEWDR